jgi:dTDP-4-amino-4,6-dideoxygalactose transaminase
VRTPKRDALGAFLRDAGVETRVYYPVPLHRQECFLGLDEPALPATEAICQTALALPFFPAMTDEQQGHVLERVTRFHA